MGEEINFVVRTVVPDKSKIFKNVIRPRHVHLDILVFVTVEILSSFKPFKHWKIEDKEQMFFRIW